MDAHVCAASTRNVGLQEGTVNTNRSKGRFYSATHVRLSVRGWYTVHLKYSKYIRVPEGESFRATRLGL